MSDRKYRPSPGVVQANVDRWNREHGIGTRVYYWKGAKAGGPSGEGATRSAAYSLGGHTACVMIEGVSGCIALTHVEVAP